ncbi:MAG: InlB B-repeat-containing protein [Treponema sp.]|uniref:InlB B-repeat-containing protein n=1 Tax=Treponema sp. TaxID=166 RepID=UPI0025F4A7D7|nr:InlB B-repeat-containing protein [Treponema sp.]MBR0495608.1 InlB B-repeat-containing protein [Treponema sp.]
MKSKREIARSSRAMTGRSSFPRMIKGLAAFLMALALVFTFASCKTESEEETVYRTVTYSTEHATAPEKLTVADGTALTAEQLPALTAEGYTFGGWYDGDTKAEAGYKVTKDVTLTAKWTKNTVTPTPDDGEDDGGNTSENTKYTVTFTTNGGTAITSQKIESGKTATEPASPTKEGFTFGGWFTDSNFATAFTFSTAIKSDITLYAKWIEASKPTYTVTFSVDGAETTQIVIEGEKASKPTDPTKTGYTFDGWYKDDTKFDFETTVTANLTLTAKWTPITYTVTYEGLNGAENPNTATSYTVESETITLQNPTKSGYTFVWMNGSDEVTQISKGSTGNITLTGKWTAISYEITYVLPDVVTNPNTVTSYTVETETITLQDFSHADYTFEGWFDAETGGNKVTSIPKGSTGNKTLYAHCTWKWIGTKNPTTAKAVGDIVFSDGSATAYTSGLTLTSEQIAAAVAVIFYAGSASDTLGAKTLGVGLQNATGDGNTRSWAPENTTGYTTNFTDIQCTQSETAPSDDTAYYSYTSSTKTYYVTGDFDGSDNWEKVCAADSTASENAATNYPAFNWVNNYGNSLTGDMATGWYLPSVVELRILYDNKDTVNSALEKAGGTKIDIGYWSSSQYASNNITAWDVYFANGSLYSNPKYADISVCAVRAF